MTEPKQTPFPLLANRRGGMPLAPKSDNVFGIYERLEQARSRAVGVGLLVFFFAVVLIWVF